MSTPEYPTSLDRISEWASRNGMQIGQAKRRFAQYGILRAFAASAQLRSILVFKGGNALDFVWQQNRSTLDLDFSSLDPLDEKTLRDRVVPAFQQVEREIGTRYGINKLHRNPPDPGKTFATWQMNVGYALQDDRNNREKLATGLPSAAMIEVEISLNEVVCEKELASFGSAQLQVSSREDIVAEKLRALLQQIPRNRYRCQDLLDIAVLLKQKAPLDRAKIANFLLQKSAARAIAVNRAAFSAPELRARATKDYEALEKTTRVLFVPAEEAWQLLDYLIGELAIPDRE